MELSLFIREHCPSVRLLLKASQIFSENIWDAGECTGPPQAEYPRSLDITGQRLFDDMLRCHPRKRIDHRQHHRSCEHEATINPESNVACHFTSWKHTEVDRSFSMMPVYTIVGRLRYGCFFCRFIELFAVLFSHQISCRLYSDGRMNLLSSEKSM
ncbi:hypothetical protein HNY73_001009 [Argiope bruennichi]|uniref:Uncharacterized protein n=1 Tax=Argiope bruennichi TaxID=94029 RepID=A0A8T0G3M5_ARGBR|nr:hypothetical protein HNY73_001009 [Argiope bruennichi]